MFYIFLSVALDDISSHWCFFGRVKKQEAEEAEDRQEVAASLAYLMLTNKGCKKSLRAGGAGVLHLNKLHHALQSRYVYTTKAAQSLCSHNFMASK